MATGSEDHGVRADEIAGAVAQIESVCAEHHVVADEESGDVGGIEDRDVELRSAFHQGALQLQTGVVTGEGGAAERVRAEEALRDSAVLFAGEVHAPAFEVSDPLRGALRDDL